MDSLEKRLHLTIIKDQDSFKVQVLAEDQANLSCTLAVNRDQLYQINREVIELLETIVKKEQYLGDDVKVTSPDICKEDLKKIAKLNLFNRIFLGLDPSTEARECVAAIKDVLEIPSWIQIQIVSNELFLPWPLFYNGKLIDIDKGNDVDTTSFWGYSHVIEQIPTIKRRWTFGSKVKRSESHLSCYINQQINPTWCVKEQHNFVFENTTKPSLDTRIGTTEEELLESLSDEIHHDSLIYLFCHSKSNFDINDKMSDSYIRLTDRVKQITLAKLEQSYLEPRFAKEPLVFINACESGGMSPLFYYGFIPYFFGKGSRGIIGTLSKFAIEFFQNLLKGEKAGIILLKLRRQFLYEYNNLLGLYYVSYGLSNLTMT